MYNFKSIKFGYASAEKEGALAPELLLRGFYDQQDLIAGAKTGDRFVFLGYKGSGKSAIGQRLALDAESDPNLFVASTVLKDFPFNAFGKVGATAAEPESRFPTSWAWLILLRLLDSFRLDQGAFEEGRNSKGIDFQKSIEVLTKLNFLPLDDIKTLVVKSSKTGFKASIPAILEATHESSKAASGGMEVGFLQLVNHLRKVVNGFTSTSRHLIVVDGLDDILTSKQVQYVSLAALLQEISRINDDLLAHHVPAKVILLCRTDLFELFPDANKNKIRRDSAVTLDWYHDTREASSSALISLADLRVQLATGNPNARLLDFLPGSVDGEPIVEALLALTRHTPRDFLQLLESIQVFAIDDEAVTMNQLLSGMRHYSIEYFLPEIKDEMVGRASSSEIDATFGLISAMRSRDFSYLQLKKFIEQTSDPTLKELDVNKVMSILYEASALGTVHSNQGRDNYTFKYRNRNSTLGYPDRLLLHRGIWKAMNVA